MKIQKKKKKKTNIFRDDNRDSKRFSQIKKI